LFRNGGFEAAEFSFGSWDVDKTVNPGEGFFIELDSASAPNPTVLTFVGEVPQGTLVNSIPVGFSLRASMVPQAGLLTSDLGLTLVDDARVYRFDRAAQAYVAYEFSFGDWDNQPSVGVAESFWIENLSAGPVNWNRTFSVN
jgi:hypothetical protein